MAKRKQIDRDIVAYALHGIEAGIEKLQSQAAELRRWLGKKTSEAAKGRVDAMGGASWIRSGRGGRGAAAAGGTNEPYPFTTGAEVAEALKHRSRARRKRTMSAEARRRISEAQKARWAKWKRGTRQKAAAKKK